MGEDKDGKKLMDGLAKIGGCGFAVNADRHLVAERHGRLREEGLPGARGCRKPRPRRLRVVLDSDGDGVPDSRDKCPDTPKGVKVNADGCWELRGRVLRQRQGRDQGPAGAGRGGRHPEGQPEAHRRGPGPHRQHGVGRVQPEALGSPGQGRARLLHPAGHCAGADPRPRASARPSRWPPTTRRRAAPRTAAWSCTRTCDEPTAVI
ncbi:MAG: hypothetical protein MZV70_39995 [Desulfobacterales bacterium]|nr:hypothetical protein [Desulfobacterales bacterium]